MDVIRYRTIEEYLREAGPFLEAREAEHNLIFGIASGYLADPTQYAGAPYLAAVLDGARVVGAALRTPPWRIILSVFDGDAATVAEALAAAVE